MINWHFAQTEAFQALFRQDLVGRPSSNSISQPEKNQLKEEFGRDVHVDLILKDRDNSNKVYKDNIDKIDHHVPEKYTEDEVKELIGG